MFKNNLAAGLILFSGFLAHAEEPEAKLIDQMVRFQVDGVQLGREYAVTLAKDVRNQLHSRAAKQEKRLRSVDNLCAPSFEVEFLKPGFWRRGASGALRNDGEAAGSQVEQAFEGGFVRLEFTRCLRIGKVEAGTALKAVEIATSQEFQKAVLPRFVSTNVSKNGACGTIGPIPMLFSRRAGCVTIEHAGCGGVETTIATLSANEGDGNPIYFGDAIVKAVEPASNAKGASVEVLAIYGVAYVRAADVPWVLQGSAKELVRLVDGPIFNELEERLRGASGARF